MEVIENEEVSSTSGKSKLLIAGYVMFALAVIFFAVSVIIAFQMDYSDELSMSFSVIFLLITFGFFSFYPAILFSLLSAIFTGLSIKKSKKALVIFILSLVILVSTTIYFLTTVLVSLL